MLRKIILTIIFLLISSSVFAQKQTIIKNSFGLGLQGGINFANQSISDDVLEQPQTYRSGIILSGIFDYGLSKMWYVHTEIRFIQKGTKFTDFSITTDSPETDGTADLVYKFSYIEIPVTVKVKFGCKQIKPFLLAGLDMEYIISAKKEWEEFDFEEAGSSMPNSRDIKDRYQSVDISFDTGCGLEYKFISNLSFIASARYTLGLNNLNKKEFDSSIKVKSTGLQILTGILFYL